MHKEYLYLSFTLEKYQKLNYELAFKGTCIFMSVGKSRGEKRERGSEAKRERKMRREEKSLSSCQG